MTVTSCAHAASAPAGAAPVAPQAAAGSPPHPGDRAPSVQIQILAVRDAFTACEQRIERAAGHGPTMAVVGASYTAGVGPDDASLSWAVDLARNMRWDAAIYGDPGAGYTWPGNDDLGPMTRLLGGERLPELSPSLVLVQAGYDDGRVPPDIERQQVIRTIELIRAEAPQARIGLVTVFSSPARPIPARFFRIDATIVDAARTADPNAIIMDPLTGNWTYQHADDGRGLHPTAAGDAWIARRVGATLRADGIDGRPATAGAAPIICDIGVSAGDAEHDVRA